MSFMAELGETVVLPAEAVAIDRKTLKCFQLFLTKVNEDEGTLMGDNLRALPERITIRLENTPVFLNATVVRRERDEVGVKLALAPKDLHEKRSESRHASDAPVKISNADGSNMLEARIVEASDTGCRIEADQIDKLQQHILLHMSKLSVPLKGEIVWKNNRQIGVKIQWNAPHTKKQP